MAADAEHVTDFLRANTMGNIWATSSKCKNQLELEKKAIELFLKDNIFLYGDMTKPYTEFKKQYPTITELQQYKKDKETKGGTQNRRKTRRNRFFKR